VGSQAHYSQSDALEYRSKYRALPVHVVVQVVLLQ